MGQSDVVAAPGGNGFIIGTGRVYQARKVPVRPFLALVVFLSAIVGAAALCVVWAGDLFPARVPVLSGLLLVLPEIASKVLAISASCMVLASLALLLELAVPHESWPLLLSRTGRRNWRAGRRFALWWPRKSGQLLDAIRADNGRWYRPSCASLHTAADGTLVAEMILPRVLRGADVAGYFERFLRLGPEVFAFHNLELVAVDSGYWSTRVLVRLVHTDAGAVLRLVRAA